MIRWSFLVDSWEHPFSSWSRGSFVRAFVEPAQGLTDYLPKPPPPKTPPAASDPTPTPTPTKKTGRTTSWDWSKFNIPLFENGFTRTRLPQPPGPDLIYSDEQLWLRQWMDEGGKFATIGAPPVVKVGWWAMYQMTYARGGADLYSEDIATYEDSALVGGGGMVI